MKQRIPQHRVKSQSIIDWIKQIIKENQNGTSIINRDPIQENPKAENENDVCGSVNPNHATL
jgi:hypothetical protein